MGNGSAVSAMETTAVERAETGERGLAGRIWDRWRKAAHAIGVVQTRFIMFAIFVALVLPTGVLMKLFRDPLHLKHPEGGNWSPTKEEKPNLENARKQF